MFRLSSMRKPPQGKAGFSLVELMIASAILATVLLATVRSQFSSRQLMAEARETELAVELLEQALAEVLDQDVTELADAGGNYVPGGGLQNMPAVLDDQVVTYDTPDYTAGDPVPSILTVEVQVDWTSATGQARSLSLVGAAQ